MHEGLQLRYVFSDTSQCVYIQLELCVEYSMFLVSERSISLYCPILLLLLNTLQAQGGHENGGKVLWVKSDVFDGHTLTLQCSQRDANKNTVVMKRMMMETW